MYSTLVNFLATDENNVKDRDMHNNFNPHDNECLGSTGLKNHIYVLPYLIIMVK